MMVWERGVGITLACGSGACAVVYASMLKGVTDNNVKVKLAKGFLQIKNWRINVRKQNLQSKNEQDSRSF